MFPFESSLGIQVVHIIQALRLCACCNSHLFLGDNDKKKKVQNDMLPVRILAIQLGEDMYTCTVK